MKKTLVFILIVISVFQTGFSQDVDLHKFLDEEEKKEKKIEYTEATFKTTRLINGHSVENTGKGVLDFRISHRFGTLNKGVYELFGLDNASTKLAFDYGINRKLMIGVGRTTYKKQYDAFIKYKILSQSTGYRKMPVTLSWVSSIMAQTLRDPDPDQKIQFLSRLYYSHQLLIGHKFSDKTSFQVMPSLVHFNLVNRIGEPNDILAIGVGGRQKLSKRTSINVEYYYQLPEHKLTDSRNSLSVGFDIETGGHVFQLHFTNSTAMTERSFIAETSKSWGKGEISFGFNVSRVFTIKKSANKL